MIIAIDEAIPYGKEAFSGLGEVRPFSGRSLKAGEIRDADALIVRSITQVGAPLLDSSNVRFVAAASAGTDHIDRDYLTARGIGFGYAEGCNANSVSEYIVTALHVIAHGRNWRLKDKSLAVIGVGNVGSRVAKKARALGMNVLLCDPPLRDAAGDLRYLLFNDVLGADILTFHVPLTSEGLYPTFHMLDRKTLGCLSERQFLINSSRGAVFDELELKQSLLNGRIEGAILDVWEYEPRIDYSLMDLVDIGTPHIAGSSLDGKIRATEMAREEFCRFFQISSGWDTGAIYPGFRTVNPQRGTDGQEAVRSVLVQAYAIMRDDTQLRELGNLPGEIAAAGFDRLRSEYEFRPEFHHFVVGLTRQHVQLTDIFESLGFKVKIEATDYTD